MMLLWMSAEELDDFVSQVSDGLEVGAQAPQPRSQGTFGMETSDCEKGHDYMKEHGL